ncbi:MAG: hypothetical protein U9Q74_15605, partial [Gemmatimonadota bacterium]|nr:hypothetical protein [Gemmatimonadota bacterium]
ALAGAGLDTVRFVESDFSETERPHRRDATVTYVDTTVHLPAGASARAWVSFAGSEVLVVRRGVELPEAFRRAERERQTRVLAFVGLFAALMLGVIGGGAIVVSRRRRALVDDAVFTRPVAHRLLGLLVACVVVATINNWPAAVFGYDTASPWINHVTTVAIGVVVAPLSALILAGLWQVMEMLRRRTGIAAWPHAARGDGGGGAAPGGPLGDAMLAGAGVGAVAALTRLASLAAGTGAAGVVPATQLDAAIPALGAALAVPVSIGMAVATAAIPVLLLLTATREPRRRWLIFGLAVAVSAAMLSPVAGSVGSARPSVLEASAALVAAVVAWGQRGALAWLVGGATFAGMRMLREVVHAPSGDERMGAAVGVLVCCAAVWWLRRTARNHCG